MGKLVDAKGNILVPGVNDSVAPVTDEERKVSLCLSSLHHVTLCASDLRED